MSPIATIVVCTKEWGGESGTFNLPSDPINIRGVACMVADQCFVFIYLIILMNTRNGHMKMR